MSRLLLDENLDHSVIEWLEVVDHEVKVVPKGYTDAEAVRLAGKLGAVFLTHDRDYANTDMYKPKGYGIVVLRVHPTTADKVRVVLERLFKAVGIKELLNRICVVSEGGTEIID